MVAVLLLIVVVASVVMVEIGISSDSDCCHELASKFKLSTTPKLHTVIDHLCNYFDETNLILVKASDEIVENYHQLFSKKLKKWFAAQDFSNPIHGEKLYNAVTSFNRYNLKLKK